MYTPLPYNLHTTAHLPLDATCGGCVGTDGCAGIFEMDIGYCYCVTLGKYCVGDCNGTEAERPSGIRSCEGT